MQIDQAKKSFVVAFALLFVAVFSQAQTIFSIDGENVSVQEFKRMYEKSEVENGKKYSKKSINEYVDLYVRYKLKLKEAEAQGLDKDPEVLREIAMYEDQLVRNEFDQKVMNNLLHQAENRLQEEICMRHVLIDLPNRYRGTADTIYSYREAMKVRAKLIAGERFEQVAKKASADIDTKFSGGDLGCFTTLQLSNYDLENQAYKMQRGEISMPIRTQLGYHIIEVTDRRPSNGVVSATQLFVRSNNTLEVEERALAEQTIREAYRKLLAEEDFDAVGAWLQEQEDIHTSVDEVPPFMVGSYEKAFENGIFNIDAEGEYSQPIQTSLGWHIFRLDSRNPLPSFDEMEGNIRDKITEDERYTRSRLRFGDELKHRYNFEKNDDVIHQFKKEVARGISYEGWLLPSGFDYSQVFFEIEDRIYTAQQFVDFVQEERELENFRSFENYYSTFETNKLLDYHKHHLVDTDAEMKQMMKEYHDGIVLFNMMENEAWRHVTANDDEVRKYYEKHSSDFKYPDEVLVSKYTAYDNKTASKLYDALKAGKGGYAISKLARKYSFKKSEEQFLEKDAMIKGQNLWQVGAVVRRLDANGDYEVLRSERIVEGDKMPFDAVKAKALSAYQKQQEENWAETLKNKYAVELNQAVIESLYR